MNSLLSLYNYIKNYKRYLLVGFIFIFLSNVFAVIIPPIVRVSIDGLLELIKFNQLPDYILQLPAIFQSISGVAVLSGILILFSALLKGICMYFMRMSIIVMSRHIEYDQKNTIFRHYQLLGQDFFANNYTGDLMNRISDDVSKVRMFTGPAIMYSLNLLCMIVMVLSIMFYIDFTITVYVLMPLPVLALTIYIVSDSMNKKSDIIQQRLSEITSFVQETFSGIQVVKTYAAETFFMRDFENINNDYKRENMALVKINGVFMPTVLALIGMSVLITVYVGGNAVIKGNFSMGNIVEYVIYVNMLTWPVASLGYVTALIQRGAASQKRIDEFMNTPTQKNLGNNHLSNLSSEIEFRDVWFRYNESAAWVLKNINFVIPVKSKLGIIGTTGSGKTTIAKLLMGIYSPTKGTILIDGIPVQNYERKNLNRIFGYVAQDIFLFSDSLKNNILFGSNSDDDEMNLESSITCSALDVELDNFPNGIDTVLGERGITLSGGQKQRVAIARALIKKPSILLIDNGLSAVDTHTEAILKQNIDNWNSQQTSIHISHRISSIQDCQIILFLDEGIISERGTHTALLEKNGLYAELFDKQIKNSDN